MSIEKKVELYISIFLAALLGTIWYSNGFLAMFMTLILVIAVVGSFVFAVWQLAKSDIGFFYTFLAVGQIKTVDRGAGNIIKVLANLEDHHVEDKKIVQGKPTKTFLEKHFGLYWIGIPPATIHEFEFVHERVNPEMDPSTPSSKWIVRDKAPQKTTFLLWEIPHSYQILGVELRDGYKVDVLFESRSQVIDPVIALYLRQGKFIDYMAQYVEAGVIEALKKIDAPTFRSMEKTENSPLADEIIDNIDPPAEGVSGLPEAVGLTMVSGFISRWDASDKSEEEDLKAKQKAKLAGEAKIETARQSVKESIQAARKRKIEAAAQRKAEEIIAGGQMAGLKTALDVISDKHPDIDPAVAVQAASTVVVATKMSAKDSPVTVLGGGINVSVPKPERKE